jgi:serine phosphatase RsbU (regulator of sigma subunit)
MQQWFQKLSVKQKLLAMIFVVSLFFVFVVSTALIINERSRLLANLSSDLRTLADIMGINSSVGLIFDDEKVVREVLASLKAKPHVLQAHVFTSKGKLFGQYYRKDIPPQADLKSILDIDTAGGVVPGPDQEVAVTDGVIFHHQHAQVLRRLEHDKVYLGGILIHSSLDEFNERLHWYIVTVLAVMVVALFLALLLASRLQAVITAPVYQLRDTMKQVSTQKNYQLRAVKKSRDELGELIDGFNEMLHTVEERDHEIQSLNQQLTAENQRMGAELAVTRRLQQMVLPKPAELLAVEGLEIAAYMNPADEVGGDYYDVLQHAGSTKIAIGDVTGHGLESGVVMLMVQTAVRALLINEVDSPETFMTVLNHTIYQNVQRMETDKNLTLSLLDYNNGKFRFTGQHELILVARQGGAVEQIDTLDYGYMVGLLPDIKPMLGCGEIELGIGETMVLYTDGVTEAPNPQRDLYGLERLCAAMARHWQQSAQALQQAIVDDLQAFVGSQKAMDDVTLLVIKRVG